MEPDELKALRERLKMTQQELADALGVKREAVTQWEMGVRPILKITELALETVKRQQRKKGAKKK